MPPPQARVRGVSNFLAYNFCEKIFGFDMPGTHQDPQRSRGNVPDQRNLKILKFMLDIMSNVRYNRLNKSNKQAVRLKQKNTPRHQKMT